MKYILDDLMTIREHREKVALSRILLARRALEDAKHAAQENAKQLTNYIRWRENEEKHLFNAIKNTFQKREHLDDYLQRVYELNEIQDNLEKKLDLAEQRITQVKDEVQKANRNYAIRHREKRKIKEHKKIWRLCMTTINQRNEENNLDELGTMRFNTVRSS